MLAKSLLFLADADSAGILGARVPITLTSRADSIDSRLARAQSLLWSRSVVADRFPER